MHVSTSNIKLLFKLTWCTFNPWLLDCKDYTHTEYMYFCEWAIFPFFLISITKLSFIEEKFSTFEVYVFALHFILYRNRETKDSCSKKDNSISPWTALCMTDLPLPLASLWLRSWMSFCLAYSVRSLGMTQHDSRLTWLIPGLIWWIRIISWLKYLNFNQTKVSWQYKWKIIIRILFMHAYCSMLSEII